MGPLPGLAGASPGHSSQTDGACGGRLQTKMPSLRSSLFFVPPLNGTKLLQAGCGGFYSIHFMIKTNTVLMQCLITPFETHFHPYHHAHFVHEETEAPDWQSPIGNHHIKLPVWLKHV